MLTLFTLSLKVIGKYLGSLGKVPASSNLLYGAKVYLNALSYSTIFGDTLLFYDTFSFGNIQFYNFLLCLVLRKTYIYTHSSGRYAFGFCSTKAESLERQCSSLSSDLLIESNAPLRLCLGRSKNKESLGMGAW